MSTKKAGGSAKNLRDSNPKYLGTKLYDGQEAKAGSVIVRQRGTKILPGENVGLGKDHTIFSKITGKVVYNTVRKTKFNGQTKRYKKVSVKSEK
ncbi:MAG: 50S ribosomal protein L27 [Patescibacteria group bacterium]